jgi:lipoprotein signal peptidase
MFSGNIFLENNEELLVFQFHIGIAIRCIIYFLNVKNSKSAGRGFRSYTAVPSARVFRLTGDFATGVGWSISSDDSQMFYLYAAQSKSSSLVMFLSFVKSDPLNSIPSPGGQTKIVCPSDRVR